MHATLATYNIHACVGMDGRFAPERIVRVLQELDADIVALQEVEHHLIDGCDMLDYLAGETGLIAIAGHTLLRHSRHYGNALLTRVPLATVNRIDLSLPGREPRGAIEAILAWQGKRLQVVATHLGLMPWERRQQIRLLLPLFAAPSVDVSVLMGDLNEWFLWGRIVQWLHAHFQPPPHVATFPACLPMIALDRLWVAPRAALTTMETHRSPLARVASDHLPLRAVLDYPESSFREG
jgi:endonuclease/exonuclease/phosphatase family metal-dependent hydrolase